MAKKWNNIQQVIPWFDSNGVRQRTVFRFEGVVDGRRVRRMIRRAFERGMQITPQSKYLQEYIGKAGWTQTGALPPKTSLKSARRCSLDKKMLEGSAVVPSAVPQLISQAQ